MQRNPLCDVRGTRLRHNYVSWLFYTFLLFLPAVLLVLVLLHLSDGTLTAPVFFEELFTVLIIWCVPLLPLLLLSLCNRFFFGRIVCVLDEKGIHHAHCLVLWEDVKHIDYDIEIKGRHSNAPCSATVYRKNGYQTELSGAPLRILFAARRRAPGLDVRLSSTSKFLLILIAAAEILVPVIALVAAV